MPNVTPRFYGGHYDSLKQALVRDNLLKQEQNIKKGVLKPSSVVDQTMQDNYMARMRIDILLAGDVVITDAQYYDGYFFQLMGAGTDFTSAMNLLSDTNQIFEVRVRTDGIVDMLTKPFTFSALSNDDLKREVNQTMKKVLEKRAKEKKPRFPSINSAFTTYVSAMDASIKPEFKAMAENWKMLSKNTPQRVYHSSFSGSARDDARNAALMDIPFKIPFGENEEANQVLKIIDGEIKGGWLRTPMWEAVNDFRNSDFARNNPAADDSIEQTWAWVLKLYNRATAYQHECNCLDIGENMVYAFTDTKADDIDREKMRHELASELLADLGISLGEEIARESWKDFFHRLGTEPLQSAWLKWRNAKMAAMNLPPANQKVVLFYPLLDLVTEIRLSYGRISDPIAIADEAMKTMGLWAGFVAGGALPNIFSAPGLMMNGLAIPVFATGILALTGVGMAVGTYDTARKAVGNPFEWFNMIKIGFKSLPPTKR